MRTVVPLVLAVLLVVPAASVAKPIESGQPAAARAAVQICRQPNAIAARAARGSHRVQCDPAAAADLPARPASVSTLHDEPPGIPWALIASGLAAGVLLILGRRPTAISG
jgi:hypothetical protein